MSEPTTPRPQLTAGEVAELVAVKHNGALVAGELTAAGKLTQAGAVDSLCRAIDYLANKFDRPAPAAPPAPTPPELVGPKPEKT